MMGEYKYITLREEPERKDIAAEWFHNKWGVPKAFIDKFCFF